MTECTEQAINTTYAFKDVIDEVGEFGDLRST